MPESIDNLLQSTGKINNLDAELILADILARPREYIIAHPEEKIGIIKQLKFKYLAYQRARGIPLAYLTGHKEFFGLDFIVDKHTLIPRPETEILVESVIEKINNLNYGLRITDYGLLFIDIGTGSGCIPIAIKKSRNQEIKKSIAVDISKPALRVAKKNAKKHNVDITFLHSNLLDFLPLSGEGTLIPISHREGIKGGSKQIIITANLPYLTQEQFQSEKSIQYEPKSALIAEDNGLALYKKLLQQINQLTKTYKLQATSYLEIDPSQSQPISAFIKEIMPSAKIEIKKDLAGLDRVVVLTID